MTVYKYFLRTALRKKWIIFGYAAIFFVISILNMGNIGTKQIAFMESSLDIGIVNNSNSDLSKGLLEYLAKNNRIIPMEEDIDYIKEEIFLEVVDAVIIIPENFEIKVQNKEESLQIIRDDRKMGPLQVQNQINKFLAFSNATYRDGQYNLEKVKGVLDEEVEVELIKTANISSDSGINRWLNHYFNFMGYVIIAIYIAIIGLLMTEFNNKQILARMKISSKKFLKLNTEIYLGQGTFGILITAIFIIGGFIIGNFILKGKGVDGLDFVKYTINAYVFSFAILCLTFLINNMTQNTFIINGLSTVLSLGTSFISGVMVPQELLSAKVLAIAKFFPTYYFVRINEMNVNSFYDMRYEIMMQILFGFAFLAIGIYFSKAKQKA